MVTPNMPADQITAWALDRMDDHGHVFTVREGLMREEAERLLRHFTERGHKQTYTIREVRRGR